MRRSRPSIPRRLTLPVMVMIESPLGVLRAEEIAAASDRIACIVMATSDLLNQLHGRRTPDRIAFIHSLSRVLLAGRAYDRAVVDGIVDDLKDMQSFEYACRLGRDLGFDGKSLVHPFQLPYSNDAFTPKPHDLSLRPRGDRRARASHREGRGTVVVNGRLIEQHHVKAAKRLLAWPRDPECRGGGGGGRDRQAGSGAMTQTISLHAVRGPRRLLLRGLRVGRRLAMHAAHAHRRRCALYIALTGARDPVHCAAPLARAMGHRDPPLDDFLVFNVAFGKTVHDISYNAVANLGYADVRFLARVCGRHDPCESEVIGQARIRTARAAWFTCARAPSTRTGTEYSPGRAG